MGYLLSRSGAELVALGAAWGLPSDRSQPAPLFEAMSDPWQAAAQLESLPHIPRQALLALLAAGGEQAQEALLAALPGRWDEATAAVTILADRGLVVRAGEGGAAKVGVPAEVYAALQLAIGIGAAVPRRPTLRQLLERLPRAEIERLCAIWGLTGVSTLARPGMQAALLRALAARSATRRLAGGLSPAARRLLVALHRSGGLSEAADLRLATGLDEAELRLALVEAREAFPLQTAYSSGLRWLLLPVGLGDLAEPEAGDSSLLPLPGEATGAQSPPFALPTALLLVLDNLRWAVPPATAVPLARLHAQRLAKLLDGTLSTEAIPFALAAAQGLRLIEESKGHVLPSTRADAWQVLPYPAQALAVLGWWLRSERWRDGLRGGDVGLGGPLDFYAGRERLLNALRALAPGRRYGVSGFLGWLRQREPLLFRDPSALHLAGGAPAVDRVARYWPEWDGRLARAALEGPFSWLGLVHFGDTGRGVSFSVTPFGRWLLGAADGEAGPAVPSRPLVVTAAGAVTLRRPDGPALALALRYASWQGNGTLQIDRESLARAARAGLTADQVLRDLARLADLELELAAALRDWLNQLHPLRVTRAVIVEVAARETLDELLRSTWAKRLRLRRLSATAAVVEAPEEMAGRRERLRRDGFLLIEG